jgi:hypothetical protein
MLSNPPGGSKQFIEWKKCADINNLCPCPGGTIRFAAPDDNLKSLYSNDGFSFQSARKVGRFKSDQWVPFAGEAVNSW